MSFLNGGISNLYCSLWKKAVTRMESFSSSHWHMHPCSQTVPRCSQATLYGVVSGCVQKLRLITLDSRYQSKKSTLVFFFIFYLKMQNPQRSLLFLTCSLSFLGAWIRRKHNILYLNWHKNVLLLHLHPLHLLHPFQFLGVGPVICSGQTQPCDLLHLSV